MCGAGLLGGVGAVELVSRSSRVGWGRVLMFTMRCGCPCWFEPRFYGSKLRVLVERLGAGLAAVAVNAEVLIWKLTRMDILTIRLCRRGSSPHPSGRQLDHRGFYVRHHSLGQCLCQMRCASQLHQSRPGLGSALARAPASLGPAPQHHTCDLKGHLDMRVPRCSNFAKYPLRLSETIRRSGIKME